MEELRGTIIPLHSVPSVSISKHRPLQSAPVANGRITGYDYPLPSKFQALTSASTAVQSAPVANGRIQGTVIPYHPFQALTSASTSQRHARIQLTPPRARELVANKKLPLKGATLLPAVTMHILTGENPREEALFRRTRVTTAQRACRVSPRFLSVNISSQHARDDDFLQGISQRYVTSTV
jgi:hypothetical protein